MTNISDALNKLGGRPSVARELGLPIQNVTNWAHRNSLPGHIWPIMLRKFPNFAKIITDQESDT
jgi:hypothetical protein